MAGALLALALGASAWSCPALARPDATAMTCDAVATLVARSGAVVLTTGPNTFDRYVRDVAFCSGGEQVKPEWVRTRDNPQCPIGYTCYVPSRDNFAR